MVASPVATDGEVFLAWGEERDNLAHFVGMGWAGTAVGAGSGAGTENAAGTGIGTGCGMGFGTAADTVAGEGAVTAGHLDGFAGGRQKASKRKKKAAQRSPTPE